MYLTCESDTEVDLRRQSTILRASRYRSRQSASFGHPRQMTAGERDKPGGEIPIFMVGWEMFKRKRIRLISNLLDKIFNNVMRNRQVLVAERKIVCAVER